MQLARIIKIKPLEFDKGTRIVLIDINPSEINHTTNVSQNKWSFDGNYFIEGMMLMNDGELEKYDISCATINYLAVTLRSRMFERIRSLFSELSNQQKKGLLRAIIDYDQVDNMKFSFGEKICNTPIGLAKRFGFQEIQQFFLEQQASLK